MLYCRSRALCERPSQRFVTITRSRVSIVCSRSWTHMHFLTALATPHNCLNTNCCSLLLVVHTCGQVVCRRRDHCLFSRRVARGFCDLCAGLLGAGLLLCPLSANAVDARPGLPPTCCGLNFQGGRLLLLGSRFSHLCLHSRFSRCIFGFRAGRCARAKVEGELSRSTLWRVRPVAGVLCAVCIPPRLLDADRVYAHHVW